MEQGRKEKLILEHRKLRDDDESVDVSSVPFEQRKSFGCNSFIYLLIITSELIVTTQSLPSILILFLYNQLVSKSPLIAVDLNRRSNVQSSVIHNHLHVDSLPIKMNPPKLFPFLLQLLRL